MPKLIKNVREQLLAEARRQVDETGYGKTTIRSVASACGIAVGTVYNYFPSKDVLIASYVMEDWHAALTAMGALSTAEPRSCLQGIYDELVRFLQKHRALFSDPDAARAASAGFLPRHLKLRDQLAELIEPIVPSETGFAARFTAEALLTWTVAGEPFDHIYEILSKIIAT